MTDLSNDEVFRAPADTLSMGGGYDWRRFTGYGPYFLCKDGLPLRDHNRWVARGWRACSVEMGEDAPIKRFAAYVADLESTLAQATTFHLSDAIRIERRGNAWCVFDGLECLNRDGVWEPEPQPSNRSEGFIARTRFTRTEAFERARAFLASQEAPHG